MVNDFQTWFLGRHMMAQATAMLLTDSPNEPHLVLLHGQGNPILPWGDLPASIPYGSVTIISDVKWVIGNSLVSFPTFWREAEQRYRRSGGPVHGTKVPVQVIRTSIGNSAILTTPKTTNKNGRWTLSGDVVIILEAIDY
jgi:hypothetical protein